MVVKHFEIKRIVVGILLLLGILCLITNPFNNNSTTPSTQTPQEKTYSWASLTKKQVKKLKKGNSTDIPIAKAYVYSTSVEGDLSYEYGYVTGLILNNSGAEFSYIQVVVGLYSNDVKIGSCLDNTSHLASGDNWAFSAYCSPWTKDLKYKIEEVTFW